MPVRDDYRGKFRDKRESNAMAVSNLRVLVLDDNPHDRQLTLRELHKEFPDVQAIEPLDDGEFRNALERESFDIVVTDFNLKWTNGVDIVRAVKQQRPHCPVIMFTATGTQEVAVEAMKSLEAGFDAHLTKPIDPEILLQQIAQSFRTVA